MLNPRSPIVNQVMNPGYNMYPGNFTVGYNGYNPQMTNVGYQGYYGVQYNNYNPWYQAELQKQQQAYEKQCHMQQVNELKKASRLAHAENGSEQMSEEYLNKRFDSDYQYVGVDPELLRAQRHAADMSRYRYIEYNQEAAQRYNSITAYHDKFIKNKDCDLQGFLAQAGELYVDCLLREQKHKDRNLNGIYDSDAYRKLISQNNQNPYSGIFRNIDDNVVGLPNDAKQKFESAFAARRAAFMAELSRSAGGI